MIKSCPRLEILVDNRNKGFSPQRCFPLNKGEEWLKPEYSQEPKVVFAKTTAKVDRYLTILVLFEIILSYYLLAGPP